MTPADRDRFEKCLTLAERGVTAGERAAGLAAAERIADAAGLTLAEAIRAVRQGPATGSASRTSRPSRQPYAWAQPKAAVTPVTLEELQRQKAETEAWRKRVATAAARRRRAERAEQEAYAAQRRAEQAERDRDWARARARAGSSPAADES
ncbi:hypothetical protein [Methylobacterium sp. J-070]|uniref:hypothetical protein n=1 Tax=Methylobacterium sp. J-070 TaxID=2836650 RepID=UPI001FB8EE32|nr:hypothetical protein [Methylobacterium sp. J-070]MCJ2050416.1 hypothetical protein [Methylobacterium sp. J-070]